MSNVNNIKIERKQDYANELFILSRYEKHNLCDGEGLYHCVVDRDWCGDLAKYIVELERKISMVEKLEEVNE